MLPTVAGPIGIFDSGYGGLTVLSAIKSLLPQYDYLYLGDNARAPYGSRSFDTVYQFTQEAVEWLFNSGCHLVILACNTASAKALRTIQQRDLPTIDPERRVLGVIRPTSEQVAEMTSSGHIGVLGTEGTIQSRSYEIEINKLHPHLTISGEACPMWVPLVENREHDKPRADYFVRQHLEQLMAKDPLIDTIILGCTHYPLLLDKIMQHLPADIKVLTQGSYVAESLKDYLSRHKEMDAKCTKGGMVRYYTTDDSDKFNQLASIFMRERVDARQIKLEKL
ncbi:MAG TPA: glutamate racemase [Proteiniphilum sp.]|nr:glutamate racemase [Proteiniphilum sp.]HPD86283.1 glutamate racemase [Proteiniphilum sp.]HPJ51060.1 glutamate racemase [Proteiniphilum sp.]HPR20556.1 glutamate racemase [Proteiniphilum sp.]